MTRCIHFHDDGVRCIARVLPGTDFCDDHLPFEPLSLDDSDDLSVRPIRRAVLRLVALLLLLMLLVPFYRVVSTLYLEPLVAGRDRQ